MLLPVVVVGGSALIGAFLANAVASKREERLEDALSEAVRQIPRRESVEIALEPLDESQRERVMKEAVEKGTAGVGLITPMQRLGGWR
jgi:short-subunit dehydrogenase